MADLLARWLASARAAGATAAEDRVRAAGEDLLARWAEPHRRYHDVAHLRQVLASLDVLDAADDASTTELAAWFHDAVYAGTPGRDERESAELAGTVLAGLGVPPATVRTVQRLVLLTADHVPAAGDRDGAALCDADLAVLAADPPGYAAYVAGVRQEYAHVPDPAFRAGRAAVLRRLLAAPQLFRTPTGRRWEAAARRNLTAELRMLDGEQ